MPSYLDFNSTKEFRDFILSKTLKVDGGPQDFTADNYVAQGTNTFANKDLPDVDANRIEDLKTPQTKNIYKPNEYPILEELETLQRRANLNIYPYFEFNSHNLIGIMGNSDFNDESELMKFARNYLKDDPNGPVHSRISQNLEAATIGRVRLIDALNGSLSTATNIVTGKEPLIESNYKITVGKTIPGKGIDFLQTVAGVEFPWSEIPGDYLSDPKNPTNYRPEAQTEAGRFIQDATGAIGSLFGIQRRPTTTRKPSDLMIEYMGQGQKNLLFDMLSYSTYAPNYTTTARSQNTSKIFNFIDSAAQGVKNVLGMEAPAGVAYIGDDRGEDVKFAMSDFYGNVVKSPFYVSLMYDEVQTNLFHRERNITEFGSIPGNLTWISTNSRNQLGANNSAWSSNQSNFIDSQSTGYEFRYGSILEKTQELLNSMPNNGLEARSHVANVIDQTSRFFKEGDKLISRGSNVRYVDSKGVETGVELCRVWTKDRPYMKYSDTMRRTDTARKYDDSVLSRPWNLNIAPMSDGKNNFDGTSTNIFKSDQDDGFYAKKYMFSLENLAWKSSNAPGYTYSDLPYCERGSNGGRVMWFPPYDIKVTEQSDGRWETNSFLGRPEPIYTYQNTERTAQISFKVIVDHPSILNLLVGQHFKNMSDEESENAINAFFAGCSDLDFYDLIDRYKTITPQDATSIINYLNKGVGEDEITNYSIEYEKPVEYEENVGIGYQPKEVKVKLTFLNDQPKRTLSSVYESATSYSDHIRFLTLQKTQSVNELETEINRIMASSAAVDKQDLQTLFNNATSITTDSRDSKINRLSQNFDNASTEYDTFVAGINELKTYIDDDRVNEVVITVGSSTSSCADLGYNQLLSVRRAHSIYRDVYERLQKDGIFSDNKWTIDELGTTVPENWETETPNIAKQNIEISFRELGYEKEGTLTISIVNGGENVTNSSSKVPCSDIEFNSDILKINAPEAFECRSSFVRVKYNLIDAQEEEDPINEDINSKSRTKLVVNPEEDKTNFKTPPIDEMKKIISKTLSECYYFKKLEEDDPVAFGTLREKLKYFHPAFHSMTPEGLNARLTFLQQCMRPGDTVPIKGVTEDLDLRARNTSFGAPPICVLRIGDFFNTKVVIRSLNIDYEDSLWDLNPEGIGVQPMIANVVLQVNLIGGSGIKEPVGKLQNALSSNFYANTEMYDERAINTADTIAGKDRAQFTKEFLESLNSPTNSAVNTVNNNKGNDITEGTYIGQRNDTILSYRQVISDVFTKTQEYHNTYPRAYNNIITAYGKKIGAMLLHPSYRTINTYDRTNVITYTLNNFLFGVYPKGKDLTRLTQNLQTNLLNKLNASTITDVLGLDKDLTTKTKGFAEELIKPILNDFIIDVIDVIKNNEDVKEMEDSTIELISALDKVNFISKYSSDMKIVGEKVYKVAMPLNLYDEYITNFDYIRNNSGKLYEDLDTSYNFFSTVMEDELFIEFLSIFLYNNTDVIMDVIKSNTLKFTQRDMNKIEKRLGKFVTKPEKEKNFRFTVFKSMKKDSELTMTIVSEEEVTDQATIDEVKKLFSSNVAITDNKLNYYKK